MTGGEASTTVDGLAAVPMTDRVAAAVAHELRTPLTSIRTGLHLLDERASHLDRGQRREVLAAVRDETERLVRAVDAVVAVTEPSSDDRVMEPISIPRLVDSVAAREALLFAPSRIGVVIDPETPLVVGDPDDVARVMEYLIAVAFAMDPQPALIEVSVDLAASLDDGRDIVRLRVARRPSHGSGHSTGTSYTLGIAAASRLSGTLGGRIVVAPRIGDGLDVTLELPSMTSTD